MEILLPRTEIWYQKCDQIRSQIGVPDETELRLYPGLHFALFEICQGTASFFSHKKSAAYMRGQSYALSAIVPFLYKESFQIQSRSSLDLAPASEWVAGLNKDCLFVILIEDNPVTGEVFNNDEIDRLLNEKKIFSIHISHRKTWARGVGELRPYTILVNECGHENCVVLFGSKYKVQTNFAKYFLPNKALDFFMNGYRNENRESAVILQQFIQKLPAEMKALEFKTEHLSDRLLIGHREVHGSTLAHELRKIEPKLQSDGLLVALSGCSESFADYDWWEENQLGPDEIRSTLVLSLSAVEIILSKVDLMQEALKKCLQ
jgi:hypothetical protein